MSKTEHPYAQVLRWIADGETVEACGTLPNDFQLYPAEEILRGIANGAQPVHYRLKPRTIKIGEYDVPEPMRVAPAFGTKYYVPYLQVACDNPFDELTWYAEGGDRFRLSLGICHATREAAEAHAKALLSFTTTEGK